MWLGLLALQVAARLGGRSREDPVGVISLGTVEAGSKEACEEACQEHKECEVMVYAAATRQCNLNRVAGDSVNLITLSGGDVPPPPGRREPEPTSASAAEVGPEGEDAVAAVEAEAESAPEKAAAEKVAAEKAAAEAERGGPAEAAAEKAAEEKALAEKDAAETAPEEATPEEAAAAEQAPEAANADPDAAPEQRVEQDAEVQAQAEAQDAEARAVETQLEAAARDAAPVADGDAPSDAAPDAEGPAAEAAAGELKFEPKRGLETVRMDATAARDLAAVAAAYRPELPPPPRWSSGACGCASLLQRLRAGGPLRRLLEDARRCGCGA